MSSPATEEEKISHDKNHISHYQKEASSKSLKVVLAQWAANPNFYDDMINEQSDGEKSGWVGSLGGGGRVTMN